MALLEGWGVGEWGGCRLPLRGSERCLQASEEGEQQGSGIIPQQAALPVLGEVREEEEQEEE